MEAKVVHARRRCAIGCGVLLGLDGGKGDCGGHRVGQRDCLGLAAREQGVDFGLVALPVVPLEGDGVGAALGERDAWRDEPVVGRQLALRVAAEGKAVAHPGVAVAVGIDDGVACPLGLVFQVERVGRGDDVVGSLASAAACADGACLEGASRHSE